MRKALLVALMMVVSSLAFAQGGTGTGTRVGSTLPSACKIGEVFFKTSSTVGFYVCTATNGTWARFPYTTEAALLGAASNTFSGDMTVQGGLNVGSVTYSGTASWGAESPRTAKSSPSAGALSKVQFDADGLLYVCPSNGTTCSWGRVLRVIASGATAMGTAQIASGACATVVTVSATGVLTTDSIWPGFNGDPTAITGYVPATSGMLTVIPYPTADNVNFKVCNNTSAAVTPGAITLNWLVMR